MADETPLNGAQMAEVQRQVAKAIETLRIRQWAVEQVLKANTPVDKVVNLAQDITNFVVPANAANG